MRIQRSEKIILLIFTIIITAIILLLISICSAVVAYASDSDKSTASKRYYTSVKIAEGDTLESLAEEYNNLEVNNEVYIEDIKNINSLSQDRIHPGCYLTLVYTR